MNDAAACLTTAGVRTVLRDDEALSELLETPLILSIVALAYQGRSAAEVPATTKLTVPL